MRSEPDITKIMQPTQLISEPVGDTGRMETMTGRKTRTSSLGLEIELTQTCCLAALENP